MAEGKHEQTSSSAKYRSARLSFNSRASKRGPCNTCAAKCAACGGTAHRDRFILGKSFFRDSFFYDTFFRDCPGNYARESCGERNTEQRTSRG